MTVAPERCASAPMFASIPLQWFGLSVVRMSSDAMLSGVSSASYHSMRKNASTADSPIANSMKPAFSSSSMFCARQAA